MHNFVEVILRKKQVVVVLGGKEVVYVLIEQIDYGLKELIRNGLRGADGLWFEVSR